MINIQNASVVRAGHAIVEGVSLALVPGRITVIIGPNGAGKSTLLKLCSGQIHPSGGAVTLDGTPLHRLPPPTLAARRAVLAQANEVAFGFTVRELAALGLRLLRTDYRPAEQTRLIDDVLAAVGLTTHAHRLLPLLSGGERQRAHLARVLVQLRAGMALCGPGTLLLDEPIAAQDIANQIQVLEIARRHAAAGGAVAAVLHDLNWAAHVADHLVVLHRGRIAAQGRPAAVLTPSVLAEVFDVDLHPGALPMAGRPFVLPQLATVRATAN
jgi:iron complex transport system ATP-binding protein